MKLKKVTALLSTAAIMLSVAPMSFADPIIPGSNWDLTGKKVSTINPIEVGGEVLVSSDNGVNYTDYTTVKFESNNRQFDFKATLDMEEVDKQFKAALDGMAALGKSYDAVKDRKVEGSFTVKVKPGEYVAIPTEDINGTAMYGFKIYDEATNAWVKYDEATGALYKEAGRTVDADGNLVITVELKDNVTVDVIKTTGFADLAYESKGVTVTKAGTIKIYGNVEGSINTEDLPGDGEMNLEAHFVAKKNDSADIYATIKSHTSGSGLGGGGGSVSKKATVVFYDGTEEHLKEIVDITKGAYTFDLTGVAVPEAEGNKIFMGWFEDKECTVEASDKESITKNTNFYAGWLDTKYKITFLIDGETVSVNKGVTGNVIVENGDILVEEDGVLVKLSQIEASGIKIVGWYLDSEYKVPAEGEVKITEDTTFYAVTKPIEIPGELEKEDHFAYIIGYPEGDVRPENSITREEVATIFFRLLTEETRNANLTKTNSFADVEDARWSNNAISTMFKLGIVTGYDEETFMPGNPITRAEFATMAARFETETAEGNKDFNDIAGHWAESYIKKAAELQWINGYEDGSFRPQNYITRAEVMAIVNRMLKRNVSSDYILKTATFWTDNSEDKWYYEDVMEATNSHTYERLGEGQIEERWIEIKANRDWSELEK